MDFRNYNDHEIISFIQEGHEEALQLMVEKYRLFIAKKISKFNLYDEYDDAFQEGLLVLYRSIKKFKTTYNKTFTRFFEMNLENCFISIIRKRSRYYKFVNEKLPRFYQYQVHEEKYDYVTSDEMEQFKGTLSSFEQVVFDHKMAGDFSALEISEKIDCDIKKVYNALDRIRTKLKLYLE